MFLRPTIRQAPTTKPHVFAFHIIGKVTKSDMGDLAQFMDDQFDRHDSVSMLLVFDIYDGAEPGAAFDWSALKSQIKSLTKIDRYAVVGASGAASKMVEWSGKVTPIKTRAFDAANEDAAWAFVGAQRA